MYEKIVFSCGFLLHAVITEINSWNYIKAVFVTMNNEILRGLLCKMQVFLHTFKFQAQF